MQTISYTALVYIEPNKKLLFIKKCMQTEAKVWDHKAVPPESREVAKQVAAAILGTCRVAAATFEISAIFCNFCHFQGEKSHFSPILLTKCNF